jgi:hypothetical protein
MVESGRVLRAGLCQLDHIKLTACQVSPPGLRAARASGGRPFELRQSRQRPTYRRNLEPAKLGATKSAAVAALSGSRKDGAVVERFGRGGVRWGLQWRD